MGIRCADHVTPLYPQKLALNSPTGGGRSVGIDRSRIKATEFFFRCVLYELALLPKAVFVIMTLCSHEVRAEKDKKFNHRSCNRWEQFE